MAFFDRDGVRLYYEESGVADGEPLLLVSGQGSDHTSWQFTKGAFDQRYRVITWDHRGTGASDKPREPAYSIELFAADAVALLDHLGISRAHAYGVSMGGRICQRLAIDHGSRVAALVLGCTTPGNRMGVRRPLEVDAHMANRPAHPDELVKFLVEQMVSPEWAAGHPEYEASVRARAANPIPPFAQKLHYLASEGHDAWDDLPRITAPVLVIHGDNDQINVTANAPLLAERIPHAEIHMVQGGRHGYFIEFSEESNRVVLDFLARHPL